MDTFSSPSQNPAPQLPEQNSFVVASPPPPPARGKLFLFVVLPLVLLAGGASAYYTYFYTDIIRTPDQTLLIALKQFADAKTFEMDADVVVDATVQSANAEPTLAFLSGPMKLTLKSSGIVDARDESAPKISTKNTGSFEANWGGFEFKTGGGFDFISLGNTFYIKLDLPQLLAMVGFNAINNKWISIDEELLAEAGGADAQDLLKEYGKNFKKAKEILNEEGIIKIIGTLPAEKIGEASSYHYQIEFDKAKLASHIEKLIPLYDELSLEEKKMLSKLLNSYEIKNAEIWISKSDLTITKIASTIEYTLDFKDLAGDVQDIVDYEELGMSPIVYTVNLSALYKNYNEDVSIEAPKGAKTAEELIEEAQNTPGTPLFDANIKAKDAQIKANLSLIRAQAELYYDDHSGYASRSFAAAPCPATGSASVIGMMSDPAIRETFASIREANGNLGLHCAIEVRGSASSFAISARLKSKNAYWCVDSTGVSKETKMPIRSARCE